jgi:2',3'-cyclic-nucleotide 2'-phosphodiesterase (5'-nucleotidase family)
LDERKAENNNKPFIDAIIQGHEHSMSHYFYKGIPIVGSISDGLYFNILYLNFSVDYSSPHKRPEFIKQQTKIEGPIAICKEVFAFSKNCSYFSAKSAINKNLNFTL